MSANSSCAEVTVTFNPTTIIVGTGQISHVQRTVLANITPVACAAEVQFETTDDQRASVSELSRTTVGNNVVVELLVTGVTADTVSGGEKREQSWRCKNGAGYFGGWEGMKKGRKHFASSPG